MNNSTLRAFELGSLLLYFDRAKVPILHALRLLILLNTVFQIRVVLVCYVQFLFSIVVRILVRTFYCTVSINWCIVVLWQLL